VTLFCLLLAGAALIIALLLRRVLPREPQPTA
jgi:hypothetical protein